MAQNSGHPVSSITAIGINKNIKIKVQSSRARWSKKLTFFGHFVGTFAIATTTSKAVPGPFSIASIKAVPSPLAHAAGKPAVPGSFA